MPAETAPSLGLMEEKGNTQEHPTMELRFISRMETIDPLVRTAANSVTQTGRVIRILQQRWAIITFFPGTTAPQKRESEWRDVPLVVE